MEEYINYTEDDAAKLVEKLLSIDYMWADKFEETPSEEDKRVVTVHMNGLAITFSATAGSTPSFCITHFQGIPVKVEGSNKEGIAIPVSLYDRVLKAREQKSKYTMSIEREVSSKVNAILADQTLREPDREAVIAAMDRIDYNKADYIVKTEEMNYSGECSGVYFHVCIKGVVITFLWEYEDDEECAPEAFYLTAVNGESVYERFGCEVAPKLPIYLLKRVDKAYMEKKAAALSRNIADAVESVVWKTEKES